jgi:hypothetical protein
MIDNRREADRQAAKSRGRQPAAVVRRHRGRKIEPTESRRESQTVALIDRDRFGVDDCCCPDDSCWEHGVGPSAKSGEMVLRVWCCRCEEEQEHPLSDEIQRRLAAATSNAANDTIQPDMKRCPKVE